MSDRPTGKNSKKYLIGGLVAIGIILAALFISLSKQNTSHAAAPEAQQATSTSYQYEKAADETAQKDSLDEKSVNQERLKLFLQKVDQRPVDTSELDAEIHAIINSNSDLTIGVSILDLNSSSVHDYGYAGAMTAASVNKVLTATDYYEQAELGKKNLGAVMSNGLTAEQNIEQMIVISDNDSWHILNDSLNYPQLQNYAHSIGLTSYDYANNKISTHDITRLLGDMYTRKLLDETHTQSLLSYMERANYRDLIIPAVPSTNTVYHKAGWYLSYLNDATIITDTDKTIVLTIFTDSHQSYNKSRIAALMQQITAPTLVTFGLND